MIKARFNKTVNGETATVILLGLEEGNITLLQEGKPIVVDLREMGLEGQILITYGKTKQDIFNDLQKAGVVWPAGGMN